MKTIFLLRHAKSDWSDGSLSDHARPLNSRGRTAAPLIANYMIRKAYAPALILCSTARRTVETLDLIRSAIPQTTEIKYEEPLYLAEPARLLDRIRWAQASVLSLMMIGHNPGTEQLAATLARAGKTAAEKSRKALLLEKYPTAALAVLSFDVPNWKDVGPGGGELVDFVRPKDLDGVDSD